MKHYDALVVGGGPAGSTTAYRLADAGASVLLVDKARFPRDKLCGGLLSARSLGTMRKVFGPQCAFPIEFTSTAATVFDHERRLVRVRNCKPLHFTSRRTFDASLVQLATAAGATLLEGNAVKALDAAAGTAFLQVAPARQERTSRV